MLLPALGFMGRAGYKFIGIKNNRTLIFLSDPIYSQGVDHVPEVPLELVNLCSKRLEQEPGKELFKESTK